MSRMRWGDSADIDDEENNLPPPPATSAAPLPDDGTLPERQVFGPDAKGIKTVIDYKFNDEGLKVKTTCKIRVRQVTKKVTKEAIARRSWKKFGDAATQKVTDRVTMASTEEIYLERVCLISKKTEEKPAVDPLSSLAGKNASLLVCRICGKKGDHWTSKCPYKDLAATKGLTFGEKPPDEDGAPSGGGKGGYVPPSMRAGARGEQMSGESMRRGRDDNSVRVTNLSEDTREQDLQELFRPFGPITRIYVAFDRETGESRGFAFINFVNRDDAQRAISKLDGYGYDNLILRVEWAAPRAT